MTESVTIDVEISSPIDKVWNALTDSKLLSQWMLFEAEDFRPIVGHKFQLRMQPDPSWNVVVDCEVLEVDEPHRLSYTWVVEAQQHQTIVSWTLTESASGGTHLHLEQSGFRSDAKQEIGGAKGGWQQMLRQLTDLLTSASSS